MVQKLTYLPETTSQTAGPYVHIGLAPKAAGFEIFETELGATIAPEGAPGERIRVEGRVLDGMGTPVKDVLIEVWQADADGVYPHPDDSRAAAEGFRGWGRVISDFDTGVWAFETIRPGPVPAGARIQAPHLNLWIVARGINIGLNTRMYFPQDQALHAADTVLCSIEHVQRRDTLIAQEVSPGHYRFDIHLQGAAETVFLDI